MGGSVDLLTKGEVCKELRVSLRTLDRLVAEGQLVGARPRGGRVLFQRSNVEAYVTRIFAEAARSVGPGD